MASVWPGMVSMLRAHVVGLNEMCQCGGDFHIFGQAILLNLGIKGIGRVCVCIRMIVVVVVVAFQ
eukprot:scaffold54356_cov45-Attheya_sp.AAC.1